MNNLFNKLIYFFKVVKFYVNDFFRTTSINPKNNSKKRFKNRLYENTKYENARGFDHIYDDVDISDTHIYDEISDIQTDKLEKHLYDNFNRYDNLRYSNHIYDEVDEAFIKNYYQSSDNKRELSEILYKSKIDENNVKLSKDQKTFTLKHSNNHLNESRC